MVVSVVSIVAHWEEQVVTRRPSSSDDDIGLELFLDVWSDDVASLCRVRICLCGWSVINEIEYHGAAT